jgi:hypothetical protein
MTEGTLFEDINVIDVVAFLIRKAKKFEAVALSDIENILIDKPEDYEAVRKVFLDTMNNYVRLIMKTLFDDIETEKFIK